MNKNEKFVLWFNEVDKNDVGIVGGKNASLGEMIQKTHVPIPDGFAITAHAYKYFIEKANLKDAIKKALDELNINDVDSLAQTGQKIRHMIENAELPKELEKEIIENYDKLEKKLGEKNLFVAVRSSATAEDLPDASFAGQQETFLNVRGNELLDRVNECFASLFTNRAISYREDKGFDHFSVALSVAVQKMVNSQCSGVMFTIDPDSGYNNIIYINGSYGLGEYIVQGIVTPDEYYVFKPTNGILDKKLGTKEKMLVRAKKGNEEKIISDKDRKKFVLSDEQVKQLAKFGKDIEIHYKRPMDIEWAVDDTGLYITQARPETVHSVKAKNIVENYVLEEQSKILLRGQSVGRKIGNGTVNVIESAKDISKFNKGEVLVTDMTDPDWEPIMKIASAIVTNKGGRTCHAAIVSRELGIPCIIGTVEGTKKLSNGQKVTIDCMDEEGRVWDGLLKFKIQKTDIEELRQTKTQVFVNIGIPEQAFDVCQLPVDGVGLAREEFIISSHIREHPLAMIKDGRAEEFVDKLASGIAKIGAAFYPRPVIFRLSDFKTNEYANLKGGKEYEPEEHNPMIGWRGASRYVDSKFEPAFRLECKAFKKVRDEMGLKNVKVMIPFCRTVDEGKKVLEIMKSEGLKQGEDGLEVYVMAEIPSNVVLADKFAEIFDGFSIGSNDLTQLTLGLDRDSELVSHIYDERNLAVKRLIEDLIKTAKKYGRKVGICGQAPSDFPEIVEFLVKCGIDSISVNPDVAVRTKLMVAEIEKKAS